MVCCSHYSNLSQPLGTHTAHDHLTDRTCLEGFNSIANVTYGLGKGKEACLWQATFHFDCLQAVHAGYSGET